jgi:transcriptional regulator with XRE-family HTH domain
MISKCGNLITREIEQMTFEVNDASSHNMDLSSAAHAGTKMMDGADAAGIAPANEQSEPVNAGSTVTVAAKRPPQTPGAPRQRQASATRGRVKKTLGSVLRARRHDLQLTQREIAAKLGVKPAHIAYLELDHRRPSLSLLNRIAGVLDLDRERLILLSHPEARSFINSGKKPEEARPRDQAWRDFKRNKGVLNRYKVSKTELQVLSQVALLGRVTAPRSFLFILNSIRQAVEDEEV